MEPALSELPPTQSAWRWAMVPLWGGFFVMGLFPEQTYLLLRDWGNVVTQNAFINSPLVLYMALVAYTVFFAYQRCREHGLDEVQSRARSFAVLVYALIGFFPVRIEAFMDYASIPIPAYRNLLLASCALKIVCWAYLILLLVRYHFLQGTAVFAGLPTLFPSARDDAANALPESAPPPIDDDAPRS